MCQSSAEGGRRCPGSHSAKHARLRKRLSRARNTHRDATARGDHATAAAAQERIDATRAELDARKTTPTNQGPDVTNPKPHNENTHHPTNSGDGQSTPDPGESASFTSHHASDRDGHVSTFATTVHNPDPGMPIATGNQNQNIVINIEPGAPVPDWVRALENQAREADRAARRAAQQAKEQGRQAKEDGRRAKEEGRRAKEQARRAKEQARAERENQRQDGAPGHRSIDVAHGPLHTGQGDIHFHTNRPE